MVRWRPDSRGRLEQAALDLYGELGYEQTTVAAIAARAGLTERTFFRHFADKREVLFSGGIELQQVILGAIAAAPVTMAPLDAIVAGLETAATELFEGGRDHSRQRQAVIDANPFLQERELSKLATLATAMAEALQCRGVPDPAANLAAEAGIVVFKIAYTRWIDDPAGRDLAHYLRVSLSELRSVTAAG